MPGPGSTEKHERILDAVLELLSEDGIPGVSIRAVARHAGVGLGLVGYYYGDKTGLIAAALRRVEEHDLAMIAPDPSLSPDRRLRAALRQVTDPQFLTTEYLSLRLQLWALARTNPHFAEINAQAQDRYRAGLAALIRAALPHVSRTEAGRRAADIDVIQNGIWLTTLLGLDKGSLRRNVRRCERLAFGE